MFFISTFRLATLRQVSGFEIMSDLNYLERNGSELFKNYASLRKLL